MSLKKNYEEIIKSLGLVFGDIGTSPIYTLTVIFMLIKPTPYNVYGILSLIIWTLFLLVMVEYAWLAMSLGKHGEGGTIVLKEILVSLLKSSRQVVFVTILTIIGISLLIGDGVITPAISILSAVEGLLIIPGLENFKQEFLILIAAFIAFLLFAFQNHGTDKVAKFFGPIMALWFFVLGVMGLICIVEESSVLRSFNPYYAYNFLIENKLTGFFILSEVILCATGGEALYADMGHLGRKPILYAWYIVFVSLILNYLGQGSFLLQYPESKNILFSMFYKHASFLYIPFLFISIIATIIASQAMISGMFSVVYQGITTRIMPPLKICFTSEKMRSQIYISSINWFTLFFVILIMIIFKSSSNLAAAYGLAVSGTMAITGIMMTWIFYLKKKYFITSVSIIVTVINFVFLLSNSYKIPHGGYWSIIIALFPATIILIYITGQRKMHNLLKPSVLVDFINKFKKFYVNNPKINGTALFFVRDRHTIPPFIIKTMFHNGIIYENNIFVLIKRKNDAFGVESGFVEEHSELAEGLKYFDIKIGYMEIVNIEKLLVKAGIDGKVIFYCIEDIITHNFIWKIYSIIKKITPTFIQFYDLPTNKLQGIIIKVTM
ncbi:KUP/HAK/KT family potassium transporter [Candidatus Dependentiae bacterium]|nr:KUP/HAK/KT family potassium transporter [Candidatus Dependentiae bacterium]